MEQDQKNIRTGPEPFLSPDLYGTNNFFSFFLAGRQRDHQLFLPWETTGPKAIFRQKSHISRSRYPINFDRSLIWIASFLIIGCGVILHLLGIYSIVSSKKRSIQTVILFNLSSVEIISIINHTANNVYRFIAFDVNVYQSGRDMRKLLMNKLLPPIFADVSYTIALCNAFQVVIIMVILTSDRLASVICPMKYKIHVTKSLLLKVLFTCHVFSTIVGIVHGTFANSRKLIWLLVFWLGVSYLVFAFVTYLIIYLKIRASKKKKLSVHNITSTQTSWKFYIVSALIVATFTFLYSIPYGISRLVIRNNYKTPITRTKVLIHESLYMLIYIGVLSDPLIYIFLKKEFRNKVFGLFSPCKKIGVPITPRASRNVINGSLKDSVL